jgi:hypothetical protein
MTPSTIRNRGGTLGRLPAAACTGLVPAKWGAISSPSGGRKPRHPGSEFPAHGPNDCQHFGHDHCRWERAMDGRPASGCGQVYLPPRPEGLPGWRVARWNPRSPRRHRQQPRTRQQRTNRSDPIWGSVWFEVSGPPGSGPASGIWQMMLEHQRRAGRFGSVQVDVSRRA